MVKKILGVPASKMVNLLASLLCAVVGMVSLGLGLNDRLPEYGIIWFLSPLRYSLLGIGFVFLIVSLFLVREAFREGFFDPESTWEDGIRFCKANILLWLILFCLGFIILIFKIFVVALIF